MELNDATIRQLLDLSDPIGVLTVTAGFVPGTAGDQDATRIDLQNQLRQAQQRLDEQDRTERARALDKVASRLGDDLEGMLSPRQTGRGRVLVVTLADGERRHLSLPVPFENRVVVDDRAFVRPLVAAIDEGRPAGIVVGSRDGARVLEWTLAGTRQLASLDFELSDAQLADHGGGPVEPNPNRGQQTTSHREQFTDRVDENRHRFLKGVAGTVAEMARERRWDRLVVSGSDRIRDELAGLLHGDNGGHQVISAGDSSWEGLSEGRIAQEAWPMLREVHRDREQRLVRRVVEVANSGGGAALGPRRVCDAANVGRIDHLLFTRDTELVGQVAEDGTIHDEVHGAAAQAGLQMTREPHLVERLVEKVLSMGGRVTRVDDDEASASLASHRGLAALLRW
jgi:hypothetical protein